MEKERKLDLLTAVADEFGLSAREVVAYWVKKGRLTSDAEAFPESVATNILPGMFVYTDNTIGSEIVPERKIKAVVAYVEKGMAYAVCLQETDLRWSSDELVIPMFLNWKDGQYATGRILEAAKKEAKQAEAAQWCYNYEDDGVRKGEAFLPSVSELEKIFFNKCAINKSLNALGCYGLDDEYASSNVDHGKNVVTFAMGEDEEDIGSFYRTQLEKLCVRPVLKVLL